MTPDQQLRQETLASLMRAQDFNPATLVRQDEFGKALNFADAVAPAQRLVDLYKRLTATALEDFPAEQLNVVKNAANRDFALFAQILNLDPKQGISPPTRNAMVTAIEQAYQPTFRELYPLIAFSLHRAADFQQLDRDARAELQAIRDRGDEFSKDAEAIKKEAQAALTTAKKAAAEHGVTQQAIYFRDAANEHAAEATKEQRRTIGWAAALTLYSLGSLFVHKIPWLAPQTTYEAVQLGISKVLIFTVLSYMLYLSARNLLAHRHNAIINKHRQNALMTYEAIAAAAKDSPNRDVILNHASAGIFAPQPTGYSR